MKSIKMRGICAAVTGALLFGFGANAMADSSVDIVNALVSKGVLTEEEGALITKGAKEEKAANAKAINKAGKVKISDSIDNATIYGDVRVRYEDRSNDKGNGVASDTKLDRARYKMTLGVMTNSGDFYSDIALAMGTKGRSDNANFGSNDVKFVGGANGNEVDGKQAIFLKRAMIGYKATDWLTVEAGRMTNPLYTSSMVWDADLNVEGLAEKFKYTTPGGIDLFATLVQSEYSGVRKLVGGIPQADSGNNSAAFGTSELFAFQGGAHYMFNDKTAAKAALTYSTYSKNPYSTAFGNGSNAWGVNNLDIWEIPAEVNYMATSKIGIRLFEHTAWNTDADARAAAAGKTQSSGSDDMAWSLGIQVGSAKDLKTFEANKMSKGDWSARLWYQSVGAWSVDASLVDSDVFDGRVNMEGTTFKAQYNVQDNVLLNFTAAHGEKKNLSYTAYGQGDMSGDLNKMDLFQFDVTYKF